MTNSPENEKPTRKIVIMKNGSYHIFGNIPLVHKKQVVSEYGEPLTWEKDKHYPVENMKGRDYYRLCRCGHSKNKPFCDGAHHKVDFDGTETADTGSTEERSFRFPGGTHIIVRKDPSLCMESGYCGLRDTEISELVAGSTDTKTRSLAIAMVERCPSGALTYSIEAGGPDIEPDLPQQIAVTTEIIAEGEIPGPLWVTGNIPIERSDGKPFETRNRVTLCNCGQSRQKPLCDGTHRVLEGLALRQKNAREV